MIRIIPKGTGFFENYDRVFKKESTPQDFNSNIKEETQEAQKPPHQLSSNDDKTVEYISREEFELFKNRLIGAIQLERCAILEVAPLISTVSIIEDKFAARPDNIQDEKKDLEDKLYAAQNKLASYFDNFDKLTEMLKIL